MSLEGKGSPGDRSRARHGSGPRHWRWLMTGRMSPLRTSWPTTWRKPRPTCGATGRQSVAIAADIGDGDDIDRVIAEAVSSLGRVDILVNNAGVHALPGHHGHYRGGLGPHPPGERPWRVLRDAADGASR